MDTHKAAQSTASLTPQTIIACVGLLVALPPTLAVLIQWYRRASAPWKRCMGRLHGVRRNSDEEMATYPSPDYQGSTHAASHGPVELP